MAVPNRMPLRPGFLLLTSNLALIIQCLSRNNIFFFFFDFTYLVRCFLVPHEKSSRTPGGYASTRLKIVGRSTVPASYKIYARSAHEMKIRNANPMHKEKNLRYCHFVQ
jgi:hypothetical protein